MVSSSHMLLPSFLSSHPKQTFLFLIKIMFQFNGNPSLPRHRITVSFSCPRHHTVAVEEGMCLFCSYFPVPLCFQLNLPGCDKCNPPEELEERREMLEALVHHLQLPDVELPRNCTMTKFPFCEECLSWVKQLGKIPIETRDENEEQQVETLKNKISQVVMERSKLKLGVYLERKMDEMEGRNGVFTTLRERLIQKLLSVPPMPVSPTSNNAQELETNRSIPPGVARNSIEEGMETPSSLSPASSSQLNDQVDEMETMNDEETLRKDEAGGSSVDSVQCGEPIEQAFTPQSLGVSLATEVNLTKKIDAVEANDLRNLHLESFTEKLQEASGGPPSEKASDGQVVNSESQVASTSSSASSLISQSDSDDSGSDLPRLNFKDMCLLCPNKAAPAFQNTEPEPLNEIAERKKLLESLCHHFKVNTIQFPEHYCERNRFPICERCSGWIEELGMIPHSLFFDEPLYEIAESLKRRIYVQVWERFECRTKRVTQLVTEWEPTEKSRDAFTSLGDEIIRAHADEEELDLFNDEYLKYRAEVQRRFPTESEVRDTQELPPKTLTPTPTTFNSQDYETTIPNPPVASENKENMGPTATSSSSSQADEPACTPKPPTPPINLKCMCLFCPNHAVPASQNELLERRNLLENVCSHFQLHNMQLPKVKKLVRSKFPLCKRCQISIQKLGSISPNEKDLDETLRKKKNTLKTRIYKRVESRYLAREFMSDEARRGWEEVEKNLRVFTSLADAIRVKVQDSIRNNELPNGYNDEDEMMPSSDEEEEETMPGFEEEVEETMPGFEVEETMPGFEEEMMPDFEYEETIPGFEVEEAIHAFEAEETIHAFEAEEAIHAFEAEETIHAFEAEETMPGFEEGVEETIHAFEVEETMPGFEEEVEETMPYFEEEVKETMSDFEEEIPGEEETMPSSDEEEEQTMAATITTHADLITTRKCSLSPPLSATICQLLDADPKLKGCSVRVEKLKVVRILHIESENSVVGYDNPPPNFALTGVRLNNRLSHKKNSHPLLKTGTHPPEGSSSTPPPENSSMCLLCPHMVVPPAQLGAEPHAEVLGRMELLESVCQHFHLNIVLPKVSLNLVGTRFPICRRCHILIEELGSISPTDIDEARRKKIETLKTNIYTQVEIRNNLRKCVQTDAIRTQMQQWETTHQVFTQLAEAILKTKTQKLRGVMKKRNSAETLRTKKRVHFGDLPFSAKSPGVSQAVEANPRKRRLLRGDKEAANWRKYLGCDVNALELGTTGSISPVVARNNMEEVISPSSQQCNQVHETETGYIEKTLRTDKAGRPSRDSVQCGEPTEQAITDQSPGVAPAAAEVNLPTRMHIDDDAEATENLHLESSTEQLPPRSIEKDSNDTPPPNIKVMCLLCTNEAHPLFKEAEPLNEIIKRKTLLISVCRHFKIKTIQFPVLCHRSMFPICERCWDWIEELGNIPPNLLPGEPLHKRAKHLKDFICGQVLWRFEYRCENIKILATQWEPAEKTRGAFTRLGNEIIRAHAEKATVARFDDNYLRLCAEVQVQRRLFPIESG